MTNKELRDYLAKWPDDSKVLIVAMDVSARCIYHTHPVLITDGLAPFIGLEIGDPEPFTDEMVQAAEECEEAAQDED